MYRLSPYVAELYDVRETQTHDVEWIIGVIRRLGIRRVVEPYCGTGRIAIPVASAGFPTLGIDSSPYMLQRLERKARENGRARGLISLEQTEFLSHRSAPEFDCVLLMGNCLYNHGHPSVQLATIQAAARLVRQGGYVILDNDVHDVLSDQWGAIGQSREAFPTGTCVDGTRLKTTTCTTEIDRQSRFCRARRALHIIRDDAIIQEYEVIQETHAVSIPETEAMIKAAGLAILESYSGTKDLRPLERRSERATYVTQRRG